MSASWGLVRFNKTGNVYWCCYEGTSDILNPFICTSEECYDGSLDCYCAISYCRNLSDRTRSWALPEVDDLDSVEIYSDYGAGFYWPGYGSESLKMLGGYLNPWEECYEKMVDGRPKWVDEFWLKLTGDLPIQFSWRDGRT